MGDLSGERKKPSRVLDPKPQREPHACHAAVAVVQEAVVEALDSECLLALGSLPVLL